MKIVNIFENLNHNVIILIIYKKIYKKINY